MKLQIFCLECSLSGDRNFVDVEPTNDGKFETVCSSGHRVDTTVGYHDFQILFEIGVNAIVDGYYREAVGSFAASYERFLEFFIRIVSKSFEVAPETIDQGWKLVGKQSERQIGAFVYLYLIAYKEPPSLLPNSRISFRNEVIHKGRIPNRVESIKYGNAVKDILQAILRRLWHSHQYEVVSAINDKAFPEGELPPRHFFMPWMTLPTNREPPDEENDQGIESLIESVKKARERG